MIGPSPTGTATAPRRPEPAVTDPRPPEAAPSPAAPPGPGPAAPPPLRRRRFGLRPWTRATRIWVAVIVLLSALEAGALGTRYLLTDHRWVIADNAQVDGDAVRIDAPATGIVTDWRIDQGSPVRTNEYVGRLEIQDSGAQPKKPIRSPGPGTVADVMVTDGTWVTQGALLAVAYHPGDIYVTARVPEADIAGVRVGAPVDVLVDASPGVRVTGQVAVIGAASAGASELRSDPGADPLSRRQPIYPGPDTDPQNPQRVDQYIPVKILFTHVGNAHVTPGQNVTVHIHRR